MAHSIVSDDDPTISRLLAMSEYFLHQTPPQVTESVRCLVASLTLSPPPRTEARTRLQLGLVLYHHTNNVVEAREHLDRAALIAQSAANLQDVSFEASSISVRILVEQRALHQAKSLLRAKLDNSSHFPYWNIRFLLQLADIYMTERDENAVLSTLDRCAEYTKQINTPFTRLLCLLYKGAFLLTHHHYRDAGEVLNTTSNLLDSYHGNHETLVKTFYLSVQVTHLLMAGQVKAAKPHLKQLQQKVKILGSESQPLSLPGQSDSSAQSPDSFQWLTKEQTFVMVYLVSVMHSVQGGYTDKALYYADKAMQFMPEPGKDSGVVSVLRAHLLEHTISCLLMQGKTTAAGEKLQEAVSVCHGHPQLVYSHRAVLHTLLGHYALATETIDKAISQFHSALQHTNNSDLRLLISLNLAVAYMKSDQDRDSELSALMQSLVTDNVSCQSTKAAISYIQGLYMFTRRKLHDAKCHLRESLLLSNKNDMNKLTSCALVILGQIFLALGNTKETLDMAAPAMQLATKIPDKRLQVWAASLLAELYHTAGDYDKETSAKEQLDAISLEVQTDKTKALRSPHSKLVQWTVGEWPVTKLSKPRQTHSSTTNKTRPDLSAATNSAPQSMERVPDSSNGPSHPRHQPRDNARVRNIANYDSGHQYQEKMEIEQNQSQSYRKTDGNATGSLNAQSSVNSPLVHSGFKNMELKLHNVSNSPRRDTPSLSRQDSQSSVGSIRGSPLPIKTPEIRLARVVTPTGTPTSNKTYTYPSVPSSSKEDPLERQEHAPMETTPSRMTPGHSRTPLRHTEQSIPNQPSNISQMDSLPQYGAHQSANQDLATRQREAYLQANLHSSPRQSHMSPQQHSTTQLAHHQSLGSGHLTPSSPSLNAHTARGHQQATNISPQTGFNPQSAPTINAHPPQISQPMSPHMMQHVSPHTSPIKPSNQVSHPQQQVQGMFSNYPSKQLSPQLNVNSPQPGRHSSSPHKTSSFSPQPNAGSQSYPTVHQALSPGQGVRVSPHHVSPSQHPVHPDVGNRSIQQQVAIGGNRQAQPHQVASHPQTPHQVVGNRQNPPHHQHLQQQRSPQFPQGSTPVVSPHLAHQPQSALSYRPQQMSSAHHETLQHMQSGIQTSHSLQPPTLTSSQGQAMLQLQQQQQLLQARATQQHLLNLQQQQGSVAAVQNQQSPMLSHSPYNIQGGLPAYYQQQMLAGLPQNLSKTQPPPRQFTHINSLQKLSQEPNRASIGAGVSSGQVRMPMLHRYGAQNVHSPAALQLMNGANLQSFQAGGAGMQGGVFGSQNMPGSPLFHYNPHQPGR